MEGIARIHELMDEIQKAVKEIFPEATKAMITLVADGRQSLTVDRMPDVEGLPVEKLPRKELWDQWKDTDGKWSEDRSSEQNAYYKRRKVLLEG